MRAVSVDPKQNEATKRRAIATRPAGDTDVQQRFAMYSVDERSEAAVRLHGHGGGDEEVCASQLGAQAAPTRAPSTARS